MMPLFSQCENGVCLRDRVGKTLLDRWAGGFDGRSVERCCGADQNAWTRGLDTTRCSRHSTDEFVLKERAEHRQ